MVTFPAHQKFPQHHTALKGLNQWGRYSAPGLTSKVAKSRALTISSNMKFNRQLGDWLIPRHPTLQGCANCSILPSRMREHGVSWENRKNMENNENTENMKKIENINQMTHTLFMIQNTQLMIQGDFFNWASLEFAKCWPVSNQFQKNGRVPDWPPLMIEESLSA